MIGMSVPGLQAVMPVIDAQGSPRRRVSDVQLPAEPDGRPRRGRCKERNVRAGPARELAAR
jgi:hypothetical protein